MVLADTSVWIEHFRHGHVNLSKSLDEGLVLIHPFVCGELACGNLKDRSLVLYQLSSLPTAKLAMHIEVLEFMDRNQLSGKGLGWIDVHLLASALISDCQFWTLDKRLALAAAELRLA